MKNLYFVQPFLGKKVGVFEKKTKTTKKLLSDLKNIFYSLKIKGGDKKLKLL